MVNTRDPEQAMQLAGAKVQVEHVLSQGSHFPFTGTVELAGQVSIQPEL
jgi:hypothetical protein